GRLWTNRWQRATNPCPGGRQCPRTRGSRDESWTAGNPRQSTIAASSHPRCRYAGPGQCAGGTASPGRHIGDRSCCGLGETYEPLHPGSCRPYIGGDLRQTSSGNPTDTPARSATTTTTLRSKSLRQGQCTGDAVTQTRATRYGRDDSHGCGRESTPTTPTSHCCLHSSVTGD